MPFDREYSRLSRGRNGRGRAVARPGWDAVMPAHNAGLARALFAAIAALSDAGAILLAAIVSGTVYHAAFYEAAGMFEAHTTIGSVMVALFCVPSAVRHDYDATNVVAFRAQWPRAFALWNIAFLCMIILGFVTKTSADASRGTILLFYLTGAAGVAFSRILLSRAAIHQAEARGVASRRVFLVGREAEMTRFSEHYQPWKQGMRVIASAVLRDAEHLEDDLALAAASARMLRPDDVFILAPWSETALIDACVNSFLRVPASLHLGPERVLDRFSKARLEHFGPIISLNLARKPLGIGDVALKRAIDIALSLAAIALLAAPLAIVALLIKLDSPGPVFFLQRRYGFNQQPFRIFKFRSMTTMDDGRHIAQAKAGDARITRVGAFIRRTSIDELPQLFNVLLGDMSLVGPRPHALAHDRLFEREIALYARRHNVKPGITGWAQVNGFRGETDTTAKMRGRVEHDLHYIDNWSLSLDVKIMFLTAFSAKTYRNAR